jgi:hypothetical protein
VPHFVIIHVSGSVEDYTINSEISPKINSYGPFPKSGQDACAIFYPESMRVIMRQKSSKELMEWNFDDQTVNTRVKIHGITTNLSESMLLVQHLQLENFFSTVEIWIVRKNSTLQFSRATEGK